jgi:hypothetical protein
MLELKFVRDTGYVWQAGLGQRLIAQPASTDLPLVARLTRDFSLKNL